MNIAVLYGGDSSEFEVSVKSAFVVAQELQKAGFAVYPVEVKGERWTCKLNGNSYPLERNLFKAQIDDTEVAFDFAFIMIHGTPGENGVLQGFFDTLHIPYSTCGTVAAAVTFDKMACSSMAARFGIKTARAVYLVNGDSVDPDEIGRTLGYPCFVKPNRAGSSSGISKVKSADQLQEAVQSAFSFDSKVIIEAFIEGDEVTCGVYLDMQGIHTLPLTEIVSQNEFFDYGAKYEGQSEEITPARVSDEVAQKVKEVTEKVYRVFELRGICRADFIVKNGEPYFIEVNTVPGMSKPSIVPQQLAAADIELHTFFRDIVSQRTGEFYRR